SEIDEGYRTNTFSYTNGNVRAWTNELGLVRTFEWDLLNRMRLTSYPDGSTVSNHYENLDLVEVKDRLNHWTKYTFNEVRQLTGETNANGAVTVYDYCGCGSPAHIIRSNGPAALITTISYDMGGRVTNVVFPDGYQINRAYDATNRLKTVTDSGGRH